MNKKEQMAVQPTNEFVANMLRQRNWRCDIQPAISELGYKPEYDLERGVKETIKWYQDNKWL